MPPCPRPGSTTSGVQDLRAAWFPRLHKPPKRSGIGIGVAGHPYGRDSPSVARSPPDRAAAGGEWLGRPFAVGGDGVDLVVARAILGYESDTAVYAGVVCVRCHSHTILS